MDNKIALTVIANARVMLKMEKYKLNYYLLNVAAVRMTKKLSYIV